MLPVPFMSFLRPLPLLRLSSVNLFQRSSLSSSTLPRHHKGGNRLLMPQPNVHLLTSNCQQLPLLYQVRGPNPR